MNVFKQSSFLKYGHKNAIRFYSVNLRVINFIYFSGETLRWLEQIVWKT